MRRRHLVAAAMLAAAGSRAALAQTRGLPVVGFLNSASAKTYSSNVEAFRAGLREIGFIEGESILIEYRWADNDYSSLPALAQDLVRRKVAVIAATGDLVSARAAQGATREIPIVFTVGSDPVPFGLVASLARPGGNSTGATLFSSTLSAKRMELLREVAPAATQVALLMNPDNLNVAVDTRALQDAARSLGRRTVVMEARGPTELDGAFEAIRQSSAGAVVVASDPMFLGQRHRIVATIGQQRGHQCLAQQMQRAGDGLFAIRGKHVHHALPVALDAVGPDGGNDRDLLRLGGEGRLEHRTERKAHDPQFDLVNQHAVVLPGIDVRSLLPGAWGRRRC